MPTAGNIEAIRDWVNRYYYKKSDVNDFFIKQSSGLAAYVLTIIGVPNTTVTIVEDAATNPQTYSVVLNSNGYYTYLFFFHSGSTLTLTDSESTPHVATHHLTNYTDTIIVSGSYAIATPVMTGYTTPSGEVTCSSFNTTASGTYYPWYVFQQTLDSNIRHCWSCTDTYPWIQYEFDSPVCVSKIFVQNAKIHDGYSGKKFQVLASNDGTNFTQLGSDYTIGSSAMQYSVTYEIPNAESYSHYKIYFTEKYDSSMEVGCINMYKIVQS